MATGVWWSNDGEGDPVVFGEMELRGVRGFLCRSSWGNGCGVRLQRRMANRERTRKRGESRERSGVGVVVSGGGEEIEGSGCNASDANKEVKNDGGGSTGKMRRGEICFGWLFAGEEDEEGVGMEVRHWRE
ncbi:hypothetical protein HAX54_038380 [Datura stramonium]|uniref:Uncharacterized protein n=1 Tax=Datura stramonium TaxID=4076 RepID=A0ABS8SI36_DATST|nr:hypothetical protein [Datura stramonium]